MATRAEIKNAKAIVYAHLGSSLIANPEKVDALLTVIGFDADEMPVLRTAVFMWWTWILMPDSFPAGKSILDYFSHDEEDETEESDDTA